VSACEAWRDDVAAYVLGMLDPDEAAAVRAHLAACPGCAAEHAAVRGLPDLLTLAAGADAAVVQPPSPILEERLLDAVAAERGAGPVEPQPPPPRRSSRPAWRSWRVRAGLAGAAVAAGLVVALSVGGSGRDDPAAPEPSPPVDSAGYAVPLQPTAAAPRASAEVVLQSVDGGTALRLRVRDLPADPGAVYEVRCEAPGWSASAGTFRVDARGRAAVVLTTAARRGEYDAIRIVRRGPGAAGGADRTAVLSANLSA
jgi:anti-sigma factor RsiW